VGFFGYWVIAKGASDDVLRGLGLMLRGEGGSPGWSFADGGRDLPADFEQIVCRCSDEGGAAAGAYVFDSDWAVVLAAREGKPAATVVVNEEAARDEGLDVVNQFSAFAAWTAATTPRRLSDDEVHEVLSREWTFAEEAVAELFERAGLPAPYDPLERTELGANVIIGRPPPPPLRATVESIGAEGLGGYEAPVGWMGEQFVLGGDVVSWGDARFVPGVGSNFLGIWDRGRPQTPVQTFPKTERGSQQLFEQLHLLEEPLLLEILALNRLGGLERPLTFEDSLLVVRRVPVRNARFVLGRGRDYIGVWDRTQPAEPVARFRDNHKGQEEAEALVYDLLFVDVLSHKSLPGSRLYLSRKKAKWIRQRGRGSVNAVRRPPGPWLISEEDEDENWLADVVGGGDRPRWFVYVFVEEDVFVEEEQEDNSHLWCVGASSTLETAKQLASHHLARGHWQEVPADVPRDLLSTVRWLLAGSPSS